MNSRYLGGDHASRLVCCSVATSWILTNYLKVAVCKIDKTEVLFGYRRLEDRAGPAHVPDVDRPFKDLLGQFSLLLLQLFPWKPVHRNAT